MGTLCQRWLMVGSVGVGLAYLPTLGQCWLMVGSVGVGLAYLPTLGQCWAGMLKMEIGLKNLFVENKVWVDVSPVVAQGVKNDNWFNDSFVKYDRWPDVGPLLN